MRDGETNERNFYITQDGGQTWTPTDAGLPYDTYHGQLITNYAVANDLWYADGWEGGISTSTSGGAHGLWHRAPDPNNPGANQTYKFTRLPNVNHCIQVALGRATTGSSTPYTVYIYGQIDSDPAYGVFRSANGGIDWQRMSWYPTGIFDWPTAMAASWDIEGRVYVGFNGNSFVYSDRTAQ